MEHEHYMYAQSANHGEYGRPRDPAAMTLAMIPLAGRVQEAAEETMIAVAALNDGIEAGDHEDAIFDQAQATARAVERLISAAYRLAAHLDVPDMDAHVTHLLLEPLKAAVTP